MNNPNTAYDRSASELEEMLLNAQAWDATFLERRAGSDLPSHSRLVSRAAGMALTDLAEALSPITPATAGIHAALMKNLHEPEFNASYIRYVLDLKLGNREATAHERNLQAAPELDELAIAMQHLRESVDAELGEGIHRCDYFTRINADLDNVRMGRGWTRESEAALKALIREAVFQALELDS